MLKPKAYDNRDTTEAPNNFGTTGTVNVTVDNTTNLPPTAVTLDPPYNLTYNGVSLRWSKNIDSDFLRYEVHKSTTPNFTPDATTLAGYSSSSAQTTMHLSPLSSGTTYYFKIVTIDTANQTTASSEVTATTPSDDCNTPAINAAIEMEYNLADKVASVRDWLGGGIQDSCEGDGDGTRDDPSDLPCPGGIVSARNTIPSADPRR